MSMDNDLFDHLRLELRRGSLIIAVLAQLRVEYYGYALCKALSDHDLDIDENTLYPLLRRLEKQGLLTSEWRKVDKRKKRFYCLSQTGESVLNALIEEWKQINCSLDNILNQDCGDNR